MSSLTVCSLPREYDPLQGVFADDHDQAHYVVLPQDEFYNAVMAKAGLKPDQDNAIRYFEAALRVANLHPSQHAISQAVLGSLYLLKNEEPSFAFRARTLIKRAVQSCQLNPRPHAYYQWQLGALMRDGIGGDQEIEEAQCLIRQAYESGNLAPSILKIARDMISVP